MAELYLVRHGQASFGAENYDELSSSGRIQSRWLGEYFAQANVQFDRVVMGTMQRHRQTADGILAAMGGQQVEIVQDAGLNEYDFAALFAALGEEGSPTGLPAGLSAQVQKKTSTKGSGRCCSFGPMTACRAACQRPGINSRRVSSVRVSTSSELAAAVFWW